MKFGAADITDLKIGSTDVNEVRLGSTLVWQRAVNNLLLDTYNNALAAYSLRKLRSSYTGSAIRVRRNSDNAETDIGFVADELDTTSLLSFVGVNSGLVTKWYDQSGNGLNAEQSDTSRQAVIVNGGTLITENSKPSLDFAGVYQYATSGTTGAIDDLSVFICASGALKGANFEVGLVAIDNGTGSGYVSGFWFEHQTYTDALATYIKNDATTGTTNELPKSGFSLSVLEMIRRRNTDLKMFISGAQSGSTVTTGNLVTAQIDSNNLYIGRTLLRYNGKISEVIIYASDKTSDMSGIESDIQTFYSI